MADSKIYLEENTEGIQPAVPLKTPFCANPTVSIPATASDSSPSINKGFPSAYSKPTQGGKYIEREEMNAMLHLATVNTARAQHW